MKQVKTLIIYLILLFCTNLLAQKQLEYVNMYKDIAISEMKRTGIPASITLAQGIIESLSGSSTLATEANNHFGIKCHKGWQGSSYFKVDDDDTASCFRVYTNAFESFVDHSEFLKFRPRYSKLFDLEINDYKAWAQGLKDAGYATDPNYPSNLTKWIDSLGLYQFDIFRKDEVAYYKIEFNSTVPVYENNTIASSPVVISEVKNEPEVVPIPLPEIASNTSNNPNYFEKETNTANDLDNDYENNIEIIQEGEDGIFYVNEIKACRARQNDNALSVANRYEIDVRKIVEFNEINRTFNFAENDIVFLQSKKVKAKQGVNFHVIKNNETLFEISQLYGVKIKNLLKYNNLQEGFEPAFGEKVALRDIHNHSVKIRTINDNNNTQEASTQKINHTSKDNVISHKVEKGETLWQLSKKYEISVDELKQINGLQERDLKEGTTIKIERN